MMQNGISPAADGPVLFLIDDFGQGGAQRQLAMIAREFVDRGRHVIIARYADRDFLEPEIRDSGAEVFRLGGSGRIGWLRAIGRLVRRVRPSVACAFLKGPASLALISNRIRPWPCPIVVCERSLDHGTTVDLKRRVSLALYRGSAAIVCNSIEQSEWFVRNQPALAERTQYIGNAVDLDRFAFSEPRSTVPSEVLVVGRVSEMKGVCLLARALQLLRGGANPTNAIRVHWYGQHHHQGDALVQSAGGSDRTISFAPPVSDVPELMRRFDAVLLPSLSEATPNAVLEAMASGRVVIATDVGDSARLVEDGVTGWIVPPSDPQALADALVSLTSTPVERLREMALAGRRRMEELVSIDRIVDQYEEVFVRIGSKSWK